MISETDRARIIAPPPLLALLCIALGFVARHFKALPLFHVKNAFQVVIGCFMIVIAAAIIIFARRVFIAHGTHPNPYRPTNAVVTTGVYGFSRNPIYLAFLLVVFAFVFFANSLWFIVMAVILFVALHAGVVKQEEKYLSQKFGDSYVEYCRQVRRWI